MLFVFIGNDRKGMRRELTNELKKRAPEAGIARVTDAHAPEDVASALRGRGMFDEGRAVVFEDVCTNERLRELVLPALPSLRASPDAFFVLEEKPDAELARLLKKYADTHATCAIKKADDKTIFGLVNALRRHDKKTLWIGYQRELLKGKAPEAIHGILFWGAKDMFLKAGSAVARARAAWLVARLAELPHEARRKGVELEYALEHFVLSGA